MMNRPHWKRLGTLLLSIVLLTLSACGAPGEENQDVAKGRYLEQRYPLPPMDYVMMLEEDANGDLVLFGRQLLDETMNQYMLFRSSDNGATWVPEPEGWLDEMEGEYIQMATLAPDGGLYIQYAVYPSYEVDDVDGAAPREEAALSDDDEEAGEEGTVFVTDDENDDWLASYEPPENYLMHVQGDRVTPVSFDLPVSEWGYTGDMLRGASNGDLLYSMGAELMQLDGENGAVKHNYESPDYLSHGYYNTQGDRLALFERETIGFYDLSTGERVGQSDLGDNQTEGIDGNLTIVVNEYIGHQALALDPDDNDAVYFALSSGLYRTVMDSPVVERLIDGELTSLNLPSLSISRLFPRADGSFLVYCAGDENVLLRFYYDPDVPTVPTTELKVYSLEENRSVRQFMGIFQLNNPDIKVSYTVGVPQGSAITHADALRTLSTEMLAGDGPDLLVLDGLPLGSYIRQGALVDLSDFYSGVDSSELMGWVTESLREDGALYAIPTRFTVPVLLAPEDGVAQIGSVADLAAWLQGRDGYTLSISDAELLLELYYPLLTEGWFDASGNLDQDAYRESIELVQSVVDGMDSMGVDDGQLMFDAIFYASNVISASVNNLTSLGEMDVVYSALQQRRGALVPMPRENGQGVFLPGTVLGVSAGSAQQELALEFLTLALSEEAQNVSLGDGMPVHRAALMSTTENPYGEDYSGGYWIGFGTSGVDEDDPDYDPDAEPEVAYSAGLEIQWPTEEFFEELIAAMEVLEPALPDAVVKEIALEEAKSYFGGTATATQAAQSFASKIDLYLAEQA